ncbi:MAG: hypothetical protein A3H69_03365 [Candidatus Sungbacteria bacterium RIFCSPLOWO2_02_FULL_47_9]|nr:MAG: hypothetical protein UX72_C0038G0011 [Parcubacteria group bacterium GW2011_GWA2_47_10]OHA09020.1 MAG: hypothetical protein A3H69_03365 [Candidatus Sungbacteria bacterium RIFCSPLOWO2_02_FULL_47_9]
MDKQTCAVESAMTLHFVMVFESRNEPGKFLIEPHTLAGDDLSLRMSSIIETTCRSWYNEWDLKALSHTIFPITVGGHP